MSEGRPEGRPFLVKSDFGNYEKRTTKSGKIAYAHDVYETDAYSVDVKDAAEGAVGAPQLVARTSLGGNLGPTWSPDGKQLAFLRRPGKLVLQTLSDRSEISIDTGLRYSTHVFWSPEGKWIAVAGSGPKGFGVHAVNPATREVRAIVEQTTDLEQTNFRVQGWSADGQEFIIRHPVNQPRYLAFHLETRSRRDVRFPDTTETIEYFDYSPDQKQLAYVARPASGMPAELVIADSAFRRKQTIAELGLMPRLGEDANSGVRLRWSPDGTMIAYYAKKERIELHVLSVNGTWKREIAPPDGQSHYRFLQPPEWSPDSRKIGMIFSSSGRGEIGLLENFEPAPIASAAGPRAAANGGAVVRMLSHPGYLSPDETKSSDDVWRGGFADIAIKDLKTGTTVTVANPRGGPTSVGEFTSAGGHVWSHDSKWIAYAWEIVVAGQRSTAELRVASVSGDTVKVILPANPEAFFVPLDWSRDGRQIVCELHRKDGTAALGLVAVDSGAVRQLMSFPWETRPHHARISPDGRFIAYERTEHGNRDIHLLPVQGGQAMRLTQSTSAEGSPVWSLDGSVLLYSSNRRGTWDLLGARISNGMPVGLAFVAKADFPDKTKRMTAAGGLLFGGITGGERDIYLIPVNRSTGETLRPPQLITRSNYGRHTSPSWSADGRKLAYLRGPIAGGPSRADTALCVLSLVDGREESFDTGLPYMVRAFLAPDGLSTALFGRDKNARWGVYGFNFARRELELIVSREGARPRGFSRDGREFLLAKVAVDLASKREREIELAEGVANGDYDLSPDGTRIAYAQTDPNSKERMLIVADRQFRDKQIVFAAKVHANRLFFPRWSPDGNAITYIRHLDDNQRELRLRAADGTWDKRVDTGLFNIYTLSPAEWSPDGSTIAVTLLDGARKGESGLLENFLPRDKIAGK